MILLAVLVLLAMAVVCLVANRTISTRALGKAAAFVVLLDGIGLIVGRVRDVTITVKPIVWAVTEHTTMYLTFAITPALLLLSMVLLCGSALALFALALALDSSVRGFGTIFAWVLVALAAVLTGLTSTGVLLPLAWSLTVIASYSAISASGVPTRTDTSPWGIAPGMLSGLLLFAGMVAAQTELAQGKLPDAPAVALILVACLMLVGSMPFHHVADEVETTPAALGGIIYGMIIPVLALGTLLRFVWYPELMLHSPPITLPSSWRMFLIAIGVVTMVACAAGALNVHSLRRLLAWQTSMQAGAFIAAVSIKHPLATQAASALLVNIILTTLAGALAIAVFEHLTGSDDFTLAPSTHPSITDALKIPGVIWAISAVSALGLPPLYGFWGKYWLFTVLATEAPWAIPLMLVASGLAALAYVAPLAQFWGAITRTVSTTVSAASSVHSQQMGEKTATTVGLLTSASATKTKKTTNAASNNTPAGGLVVHRGGLAAARQAQPQSVSSQSACRLSPGLCVLLPSLATIPLIVVGVMPQLAWQAWLAVLPNAPDTLPVDVPLQTGNSVLFVLGAVLLLALWRAPWQRRIIPDEDMVPVVMAPDTLAKNLVPIAWLSRPDSLVHFLWRGLLHVRSWLDVAFTPFEKRYYLAGVLVALISLIVIMAQG